MNDREYALMRQVEDTFWWYVALRKSVAAIVREHCAGRPGARILDAGCGTGGMMEVLRRENGAWELTGIDAAPQAIEHTRQRGFANVAQGSVDALPFDSEVFDAVVCLDVLYFEGVDEARAMAEFQRVLKPGGILVLNLPAFEALRGEHDVAVRGARRYTPMCVRKMCEECRLEPMNVHCWNLSLFFPLLCWRAWSRMRQPADPGRVRSDLRMPHALLNTALTALARLDMAMCRTLRSPLGTSVQAVARKPSYVEPTAAIS